MACGCKKSDQPKQPVHQTVKLTVLHERAAICQFCTKAEHGAAFWRDGAVSCGVTGEPVLNHITASPCPLGKHPAPDGRTVWAGLRWHGVPFPIRLALWAFGSQHYPPSAFPGCGCIARLKALFA